MPRLLEERSAQRRAQQRQQPPPEKPRSPWSSLLSTAQLTVGLAAYIALIGFIVNMGILRQSTSLIPLKIVPLTYLTLGVTFIFLTTVVVLPYAAAYLVALYFFGLIVWGVRDKRLRPIRTFRLLVETLLEAVTSKKATVFLIIAFLVTSAFSPSSLFDQLPPVQSTTQNPRGIILIFKEPIDTTLWSLSVDPQNTRRTQRLNLIAELEDGLLVRDANTGVVVEVKNEAISGLIDNSSLQPTSTSTPSGPTPTAGP
jgi:hypothetical protein